MNENSKKFIKRLFEDETFSKKINSFTNMDEALAYLKGEKIDLSPTDLQELITKPDWTKLKIDGFKKVQLNTDELDAVVGGMSDASLGWKAFQHGFLHPFSSMYDIITGHDEKLEKDVRETGDVEILDWFIDKIW